MWIFGNEWGRAIGDSEGFRQFRTSGIRSARAFDHVEPSSIRAFEHSSIRTVPHPASGRGQGISAVANPDSKVPSHRYSG